MSLLDLLRSEFFEDWLEAMRSRKLEVLLDVVFTGEIDLLTVGTVVGCRLRTSPAGVLNHLWLGLQQTDA